MRSALLEIDWQNWVLALAHDPWSAHLGREVRRLLANLGWPVISTRYLSPTPGDDRADPDHPDAAFVDGFEPRGQPVITKYDRDIFDVAQTDETLRGLGVEHVVLTGLVTGHGIRLAALSALDRGYAVTVVSNACADTTGEAHLAALDELRAAGVVVSLRARRLDRLHQTVVKSRRALELALRARAQYARDFAGSGTLDVAGGILLTDAAEACLSKGMLPIVDDGLDGIDLEFASRGVADDRRSIESSLSRTLRLTVDELEGLL